jgi:hypothetical protein
VEKINKTSTLSKTISKKREATSNDAEMEIRKREMFNNINSFIKDIETMKVYGQENVNRSENKLTEINKQLTIKETIIMKKTNEGNVTIEEKTDTLVWKRLAEVYHYQHDPLTAREEQRTYEVRINKDEDFEIPSFIIGLQSAYSKDEIESFMLDVLDIDCVVDSVKTRSQKENNEKIYDVLLWVTTDNYMRILAWDEIFSEIVTKDLYICEPPSPSIKDYLFFFPADFLKKSKNLIAHSFAGDVNLSPLERLIQNYCDAPKALLEELAQ